MTSATGPVPQEHDDTAEPVRHIWIRDEDPQFCRALALANEVVSALTYNVVEPAGDGTVGVPTLSAVLTEAIADRDGVLMAMIVFALARTARNLAHALELERGCTTAEILRDFLIQPVEGAPGTT